MVSFSKKTLIIVFLIIILLISQYSSLAFVNHSKEQTGSKLIIYYDSNSKNAEDSWWTHWSGDKNHNNIEDSIDELLKDNDIYNSDENIKILIDYDHLPAEEDLEELQQLNLEITFISSSINTIAAEEVSPEVIPSILNLPGVVMIEQQTEYVPLLDISVPAMKVRESSTYANVAKDFGVTGEGIVIAIIDTGVDDDHNSLDGKYIAGVDYSGGIIGFKNPDDKDGHGTHCAGIALGDGGFPDAQTYMGVAPNAGLVDVKVFNDWSPTTSSSNVMSGIQWCIDNQNTYGIDVLSISIGDLFVGDDDGQGAEAQLVDAAVDAGMVVVVAAGNDGPNNNGFSSMSAAEKVITVGSINDQNTIDRNDDEISDFSSRGPRADDGDEDEIDEFKPDVCAPGDDITSAMYAASAFVKPGNGYTDKSGTSMAAPHVAGLAALILEANPNLEPQNVKNIIRETAEQMGSPYNSLVDEQFNEDYGWGIVDGYEAVKSASGDFQKAVVTSFTDDDTIGGIVNIEGTASNDKGPIVSVELSFDEGGNWVTAFGTYNWNYTWDSTEVINGKFTLYVRTSNGTKYSDIFQFPVTVKNILPSISYPYADIKLKGTVRMEGTLSVREPVNYVEIRVDDGDWITVKDKTAEGTFITWYYELPTKSYKNGWHTIYARTYVDGIYSKETSVRVKFDNPKDDSFPGFEVVGTLIAISGVIALIRYNKSKKS